MQIIICEDDNNQRNQLVNLLKNKINDSNFEIALSTDDPNEVISYVSDNYKKSYIYFFDVDLKDSMNGIELAKKVREFDSYGYIIFLTAHAELTLLTFQYKVRALDYIIKGNLEIIEQKIRDCFEQIKEDLSNKKKANMIPIEIGNKVEFFDIDNIIFFETASTEHKIRLHTSTGYYEFYGTLKEMEKQLPSTFYKPYRSYLINTKKVKSIDKQNLVIHMENGETCYVAVKYLKGLLSKCCK